MTLLTKEERNQHCYKVSTSSLSPLRIGLDGTFNSGPFVRVDVRIDDLLKHQLRKVIFELNDIEEWSLTKLRKWVEAAKAELK